MTLRRSLEREAVADMFEGEFGGVKCLFFCKLWFFRPLHNEIAPPLTEVKGKVGRRLT